jgi:quinol monooxygenase YgiN
MSRAFDRNEGNKMSKNLTIVANIHARSDKVDLVTSELEKLIDITRNEEGCLQYDLHQDNEDPAHFLFFENWESRDLWQGHMGNQHLKDYMAATEGAVEKFTLNEMTKICW